MTLYRSEKMGFYTLMMPKESAIDILDSLGSFGYIQFIDSEGADGANFKRGFSSYIKRIEEMFQKISLITKEMKKYNKKIYQTEDYEGFLVQMNKEMKSKNVSHLVYFDQVEQEIDIRLEYLNDQIRKFEEINHKRNTLLASRIVLKKSKDIFEKSRFSL